MSALQEHVLGKYFGYRRRYVDHILNAAPERASLAVLSELARLTFAFVGNGLCAAIFWALAAGAAARAGGLGAWPVTFAALALVPTVFGLLSARAFLEAARDRRRVQERSTAMTNARRS